MSSTVTYKGSTLTTVSNTTKVLDTAGTYLEDDITITDISQATPVLQTKSKSYTPTETAQSEDVVNDAGYDGLEKVSVSVGAISSSYVGSAITRRDSTDLSASGATVSVPAGYYSSSASKAVSSGTEGTPTATKGAVSNHSISVTPSVTNSAGYISGSTKTGTAVSVSASELVSGTKSISANGTGIDVTNYASVDVSVSGGGPTLQTKTVSYTPTETAQSEDVEPDSGYDGLDKVSVSVGAISSTYVGSGITRRDSTDLSASAQTVTVPSGYYESEVTKSVSTMTLPTSTSASATTGYTSKATVSRSTADQYINIPTGYNTAGAYYKVNAVANGSATGPSSLSGSSASISTGTNTITLTKTGVTTTPTVSAGYVSSATASTATVTLTASATINPTPTASGATVTVPAGYYTTQTTKSVTSGSATGPSSITQSSATVSTGTNTLTLTKTGVSTTPTVSAGYVSSATASTATVALTASVTTKAATTYNTSSTDQTIASGTYLTGTQTIKAVTVSGLSADTILSGTTVMVGDANDADRIASVSGSVTFQTYYTGSGTPSSSLGNNGDIYLQS